MATVGDFARLQVAIRRTWLKSEFYREHWLEHGVPYQWVPAAPEELDRLPVVTKEDILAAQMKRPPWGGNLCVEELDVAQIHLTTGTSGIGQERYAATASDVHVMGSSWGPQYRAIGLERGDVALMTIPVSFFCAGLSALEGAKIHGLIPIFSGVASKELMLDFLREHPVRYLYGIESLLLQLGNLARQAGGDQSWRGRIKGIQSVGASPQLLELAHEVFGAKVFEVYGCTQAAAKISSTCHLGVAEGSNHFHDDHLYIELRDPNTGMLVEDGEAEIILSTPYREACPVFRFAMRDKVEIVPPGECRCGSSHIAYRPGSLGRIDSMLKIKGVNVWPQQVEQLLLNHRAILDYRAEVRRAADGADELLLRILKAPSAPSERLEDGIADLVRERTMVRPRVILEPNMADSTGQYKVKRWSDTRRQQTA